MDARPTKKQKTGKHASAPVAAASVTSDSASDTSSISTVPSEIIRQVEEELEENPAALSKRQKWKLDELATAGIIGEQYYKKPNLSNHIHPIFQFKKAIWTTDTRIILKEYPISKTNFVVTQEIYDFYKPAFQLASRFITEEQCLDWWKPLALGDLLEKADETSGVLMGSESPTYSFGDLKAAFQSMAKLVKLRFGRPKDARSQAWGFSWRKRYKKAFKGSKIFEASKHHRVYINLGVQFFEFARACLEQQKGCTVSEPVSGSKKRKPSATEDNNKIGPDQIMRVQWMLAATLVHELAHAVWSLRCPPHRWADQKPAKEQNEEQDEPRYRASDEYIELGHSWEDHILGFEPTDVPWGRVEGNSVSGVNAGDLLRYGIVALTPVSAASSGGSRNYDPVPMGWVSAWFQDETWAEIGKDGLDAMDTAEKTMTIRSLGTTKAADSGKEGSQEAKTSRR